MSNAVTLHPPPFAIPFADQSGIITPAWQKWLTQVYLRIGQRVALPNVQQNQGSGQNIGLTKTYATLSGNTIYQSPSGISTVIDTFEITNSTGKSQTVTVYIVPFGSTPQSSNMVLNNASISAFSTLSPPTLVGLTIGGGGYITCFASVGNSVLLDVTGRQVS